MKLQHVILIAIGYSLLIGLYIGWIVLSQHWGWLPSCESKINPSTANCGGSSK
jgi:hypothetical protein